MRIRYAFLVFIITAAFAGFTTPRLFLYDAENYWHLRQTFYDPQGRFSIINYADQLRGYIVPFWLLAGDWLVDVPTPDRWVDDYLTVVLLNSVLFTIISCWLLPDLFAKMSGKSLPKGMPLALAFVLFFFLRGYLYYPLSDLPALTLLLSGLLALLWAAELSAMRSVTLAALAGVLLMAAYLARPVYLLAFGAAGLVFLLVLPTRWAWRTRAFGLVAFLLGGGFVLFPQYQINRIHYGTQSPFISSGLYDFQTTVGILIQRYETNVDISGYSVPQVFFVDMQAQSLLKRAGRADVLDVLKVLHAQRVFTVSDIFSLFTKYPLDVSTIYLRHIFNGLTFIYDSPYVKDLYTPDLPLMWISYTVLFVFLFFFQPGYFLRHNPVLNGIVLLAWVLPAATAIPGAIEVRFMFSLQAFMVTFFVWWVTQPSLWKAQIAQWGWWRLAWLYGIFLLFCFTLSGLILTTVPDAALLITPR